MRGRGRLIAAGSAVVVAAVAVAAALYVGIRPPDGPVVPQTGSGAAVTGVMSGDASHSATGTTGPSVSSSVTAETQQGAGTTNRSPGTVGRLRSQDSYGPEERAVSDALRASAWRTSSGGVVRFGPDSFVTEDGVAHPWSVSEVRHNGTSSSFDSPGPDPTTPPPGAVVTTDEVAFLLTTDQGASVATLRTSTKGAVTTRQLTCLALESGQTLAGGNSASALTVIGRPLSDAVGTDADAVLGAVRSWALVMSPNATKATWDGASTKDPLTGDVTLRLSLNDGGRTVLTVKVEARTHAVRVMETGE